MSRYGIGDRSDKPLLGAVLCCTSVSPELRTQYADFAIQMGAEHKLDLTSDVTHLLVGDTQTLKYQYVAREREDVKVLLPDWVLAVRDSWMKDEEVNLNALEAKFQVPTFAGLKICITGFDDLALRAGLQEKVSEHGGEYTGDLTKDVTHLIAFQPVGKKYEYATAWGKKIVGIKWFAESLERGLQLDEALYHPSKPQNEQGVGAWNREVKTAQLGKRTRDEQQEQEPPRKLRRTASTRLGGQNDSLWGDIVGGGGFDSHSNDAQTLRPSKSMPALRPTVQAVESFVQGASAGGTETHQPEARTSGFLSGKVMFVLGFDSQKTEAIKSIVLRNDGLLADADEYAANPPADKPEHILIVPHACSRASLSDQANKDLLKGAVTELWLERCLEQKIYVDPKQYPLGVILERYPIRDFKHLVINCTGFQGIERLHVAKITKLLGASYDETFKPGTSVLISRTNSPDLVKVRHARQWRIPIVSLKWLFACIQACGYLAYTDYLLMPMADETCDQATTATKGGATSIHGESVRALQQLRGRHFEDQSKLEDNAGSSAKAMHSKTKQGDLLQKPRPGSDFSEHSEQRPKKLVPRVATIHDSRTNIHPDRGMPLKEINSNSPTRSRSDSPSRKDAVSARYDGGGSAPHPKQSQPRSQQGANASHVTEPTAGGQSLNDTIQDLLKPKARAKGATSRETNGRTKKLLGRALSNLSNSSLGTSARVSRASSVDSMNTDGLGSEIAGETSTVTRTNDSLSRTGSRGGFTGRAKPGGFSSATSDTITGIGTTDYHRQEYNEEETGPPQQTQLGYGDSDEAAKLREELAARRRHMEHEGLSRSEREHENAERAKRGPLKFEGKRIVDDDALLGGWAGGRRTRHKQAGLGALADF